MLTIAILDDYEEAALSSADWSELLASAHIKVFRDAFSNEDELIEAVQDCDILCLMRERSAFPRSTLQRLKRLRLIVYTGVRNRKIDIEAADKFGIAVANTGHDPFVTATPELTWALILSAARRIPLIDRMMHEGGWCRGIPLGSVISGKTLGVLGLGKVGGQVAAIGQAFGMNVIAWSENLKQATAAEAGVVLVSKQELFARSDILSLHLVLSDRTKSIVGRPELQMMKKSSILVNCARGALIDESALVDALTARQIALAALDVFHSEPLEPSHPLRRLDNVILTPHIGYVTAEAFAVYYSGVVDAVTDYIAKLNAAGARNQGGYSGTGETA